jgi:hypothetical protein
MLFCKADKEETVVSAAVFEPAVSASTCSQRTPSSSTTQTGTPRSICRHRHEPTGSGRRRRSLSFVWRQYASAFLYIPPYYILLFFFSAQLSTKSDHPLGEACQDLLSRWFAGFEYNIWIAGIPSKKETCRDSNESYGRYMAWLMSNKRRWRALKLDENKPRI